MSGATPPARGPARLVRAGRRPRALLASVGLAALAGCTAPAAPPNVLVFVVDTLRSDGLGSYGNPRQPTPHIDAVAREGVVFEQASSPSSWTRASVATLLLGVAPPAHGTLGRGDALPGDMTTLAERLARDGYRSAFVTSNPNVGSFFGFERGFDDMIELYGRREPGYVRVEELSAGAEQVVAASLDWLDRADRPFFLVALCIDPHSPYQPPAEFDRFRTGDMAEIDGSQQSLQRSTWTGAQRARIRSLYEAEIASADAAFGTLVQGLRERGLLDHTLLVVTSDHGEEFWERGIRGHGQSLAEAAIRIPLIVRAPFHPRVRAGTRRGDPVGLVDVAPSVLDLLGLPPDPSFAGRPLLGEAPERPSFASLELEGHQLASAREARWKLVRDLETGDRALYDLADDPHERTPLAPPAAPDAFRRLDAAIDAGLAARRPGRRVGALPDDVEATLRALGYLEPASPEPRAR